MDNNVSRAIILVGGWGTRLRPLTYTIPKPLVPFCNRPMLKYQIEKLVGAGVREIVLAINYYSDIIIRECAQYEREFGIRIVYSREDRPLGTAGPLALARQHLEGGPFFVLNSDICCDVNLNLMKEKYLSGDHDAIIMVHEVDDPTKYGLVKIEGESIVSFVEKPKSKEDYPQPWIINAGMYIFSEKVLDLIEVREMSLEMEVFPVLAASGRLAHFAHSGYWMDIGQIRDYLEGQRIYLLQHVDSCSDEIEAPLQITCEENEKYQSPGMYVGPNVVIGCNVKIGRNVVLENCTIFNDVVIGDNTTVCNSVIGWGCVIGNDCCIKGSSALGQNVSVENGLSINALRIEPKQSVKFSNLAKYIVNV